MNFPLLCRCFGFFLGGYAATAALLAADSAPPPDPTPAPEATAAAERPQDARLPTVFVAGDSTAARGTENGPHGWGVPFHEYFDATKINVVNRARGGRSSRTFITEGLWDQLIADVKPGDYVLIQFGHNDGGAINAEPPGSKRPLRARGSLPGIGDESTEIDNVLTHRHETVHTFGWYIRRMIADVRAKGATPIVLSLTVRNYWKDGIVERGSGNYRAWDHAIADEQKVAFVDLTRIVADEYQQLGEAKIAALFTPDHVHTNAAGAEFNAVAVVAGLKGLRHGFPTDVFSAKGVAVARDDLGWLNLPEPANPALPTLMLIGDSTVRNGRDDGAGGQWGWGDFLAAHLDTTKINLVNRAVGGTSTRSFTDVGYWWRALLLLKRGDFLVIQFGHNDDKKDDRGTLKGADDRTEVWTNPKTGKSETVHTYGWYLDRYVREAKEHGITPIVCSSVPRKLWHGDKIDPGALGGYRTWAHTIADAEHVGFLDLNARISAVYERMGPKQVDALFADEHTHTTQAGAQLNASIVAEALHDLPGAPLDTYLKR
jgi:lysophospholipase L1-like esterase